MASMPSSARAGEVPCPDPSAHGQSHKLSEQASTAALYVTDPARATDSRAPDAKKKSVLDADGKLSSSSAATSLKYARPQDLPSFPSSGLGNADSAGKAAMLAKDYKMKDLWQPELSSAGSKAALLAHRDGGKLDLWQPTASKDGNSAATLAMKNKSLSPQLDYGYTADGKSRALQAANLSIHKGRSESQPAPATSSYPDSKNSAFNALNAATVSHRASTKAAPDGWDSEANQAARIKNSHINPQMFTEHPPVRLEREEKEHDAALRASAVSMAKQMYEYQNRTMLEPDLTSGKAGADAANARKQPTEQLDVKQEALRYIHLQDAAHKLAQERLAKIDKDGENARYREYYGYPDSQGQGSRKTMNRLSMRGRNRKRSGSEGTADLDDSDDEEQARRIRSQMTQLNSGLSSVDEKKRTDDRAGLMAAAEKKVRNQMHNMDEKVFADTGKVPPAMMEEWEAKARKRAQEDRDLQSRPENKGKTHIGGGKFIDQSEIEAIAAARLKPTLDEITVTAEKRRARDEELRVEKDKQETAKMNEKMKDREQKDEWRRHKDHDKAVARKEKEEAKARKEEEKRVAKDEKRKSRETKRPEAAELGGAAAAGTAMEDTTDKEAEEPETKKRSGTLGRITSRLRRNKKQPEEEREVEEKEKPEVSAAALGTAGAAAGGVVVGEAAGRPKTDGADEVEDDDELVSSEEDEPVFDAHPAVIVPVIERSHGDAVSPVSHTGGQTDALGADLAAPRYSRPDLERHISTVETSEEDNDEFDDSDDDDDDVFGEPEKARNENELAERGRQNIGTMGHNDAHIIANRVGTAPVGESTDAPYETNERTDVTLPEKEEHYYGGDAAIVGGAGAVGVGAYETAKRDENALAPSTANPPKSDVANVPEPQKLETSAAAPSPTVKTGPDEQLQAQEPADKESKGIRGFFSKLTHRQSKPESEMAKPKTSSESKPTGRNVLKKNEPATAAGAGTAAVAGTEASEQPARHVGTDGPIGDDHRVSGLGSNGGDPKSTDGMSSSGADEDDVTRGRSSISDRMKDYAKAEFGLGSLDKGPHPKKSTTRNADDEDDHFEEARDHFDEGLAPPPAFAGQAKSESPVRGTRFREEV